MGNKNEWKGQLWPPISCCIPRYIWGFFFAFVGSTPLWLFGLCHGTKTTDGSIVFVFYAEEGANNAEQGVATETLTERFSLHKGFIIICCIILFRMTCAIFRLMYFFFNPMCRISGRPVRTPLYAPYTTWVSFQTMLLWTLAVLLFFSCASTQHNIFGAFGN